MKMARTTEAVAVAAAAAEAAAAAVAVVAATAAPLSRVLDKLAKINFIVNSLILLRIYEMSPFPDIKTCMNGQARNYVGVTTLPCWPNLDNIVVCWRHVANMRN